jgi:hypothetical protein
MYWIGCWIFAKISKSASCPEQTTQQTYTAEISARIERMHSINQQIKSIEELITDVQLAENDRQKNIGLSWNTAAGKNLTADIWVNGGSEVSAQMLELAEKRRKELITTLFSEIEHLTERHGQNMDETTTIQSRGGDKEYV